MAWDYFAAECGSNIIEKFSRMFVEGVKSGGKPDQIGKIISENFVAIVTLRKSRYQTASNFKGLLYGLVAGMAFSLFVGVGIISMLKKIFAGIDLERISVSMTINPTAWILLAMYVALALRAPRVGWDLKTRALELAVVVSAALQVLPLVWTPAAELLGTGAGDVLVCSTGLIGLTNPRDLDRLVKRTLEVMKELGTDVQYAQWSGIFVPAATPGDGVDLLDDAVRAGLAGFVVLMMLMVTVIYNDLTRISWIEHLMPWR